MEPTSTLSAKELLEAVYAEMKENAREIILPQKAMAEIANDSDWHRTRIGYTGYTSAALLEIGSANWALAFGTKCGQYPAEPYNCDISAVRVDLDGKNESEIANVIFAALEMNERFRHALVFAMADGQLALSKYGVFFQKGEQVIRENASKILAAAPQVDHELFTMDLRPVVTAGARYRPEAVALLASAFRAILESSVSGEQFFPEKRS